MEILALLPAIDREVFIYKAEWTLSRLVLVTNVYTPIPYLPVKIRKELKPEAILTVRTQFCKYIRSLVPRNGSLYQPKLFIIFSEVLTITHYNRLTSDGSFHPSKAMKTT